jgi:hypothetical protein
MFDTTVVTPPTSIAMSIASATSVSGLAAHHIRLASAATTTWIHEPAAVTQRRARSSGKLQASLTLQ